MTLQPHPAPFEHVYAAARDALRAGHPERAAADLDALGRSLAGRRSTGGRGATLALAWAALLAPPAPAAPTEEEPRS